MSGSDFGVNLIAGININLRKIIISLDCTVPIETAQFSSRTGSLDSLSYSPTVYRYPKSANLIGLEIAEGVTFRF